LTQDNVSFNSIIDAIKRIESLEESVRKYINTSRYQAGLIQDLDNWNQICSSLDTIGDTLYAFQDYLETSFPKSIGLSYIYTYGILQALFIQQDAMRNLSEAFDLKYSPSDKLGSIRAIRNASIGHPTKNKVKKATYYNYISRMTMSKEGFTLMRSFEQGRNEFIDVDLYTILNDQLHEIEDSYKLLANKLDEADKMHKEKYKNELIVDVFHSSFSYLFSKVAEGIHSPNSSNTSFGLSMLNSIKEAYQKFEKILDERNDLHEYTKYDLDEYNHAISKLENYLSGTDTDLTEKDAYIYHFFIREQHKHFVQIANEIDAEYNKKL